MENNNGSTYYNPDNSRSFNQTINTGLSGLVAHPCSEVLIINRTGQDIYIYDSDIYTDANRLLVLDDESIVLKGITNTSAVSAKTATGSGDIYYRAQMFSNTSQR